MWTFKECEKGGLSASGAFDASEAKVIACPFDGSLIHHQFLQPQTGSFSNCRKLCWSVMEGN